MGAKGKIKKRSVYKKYRLHDYMSTDVGVAAAKGVGLNTILLATDEILYEYSQEFYEACLIYNEWQKAIQNDLIDVFTKEKYPLKKAQRYKQEPHPLTDSMALLHLHIAKKLGIPTVRLEDKSVDSGSDGHNYVGEFDANKHHIAFNYDIFDSSFMMYSMLTHETRHAYQAYLSYKYLHHQYIPKSDLDKLLLLFSSFHGYIAAVSELTALHKKYGFDKIIKNFDQSYFKVGYFEKPQELDAYIYEVEKTKNLHKKYTSSKTVNSYVYLLSRKYIILNGLNYHKEGLNNPQISNSMKIVRKLIYHTIHDEWFGKDHANMVRDIVKDNFNIEKAFLTFTDKLDAIYDEVVEFANDMRESGFEVDFEKNGILYLDKLFVKDPQCGHDLNKEAKKYVKELAFAENPEIDYENLEDLSEYEDDEPAKLNKPCLDDEYAIYDEYEKYYK